MKKDEIIEVLKKYASEFVDGNGELVHGMIIGEDSYINYILKHLE